MNDYYNPPGVPDAFTLARASQIEGQFNAVAAAFDKLPGQAPLWQGRINFDTAGGTANALTAEFGLEPEAYVEGMSIRLLLTLTNTGAPTLNMNGLGAVPIVDGEGNPLEAGILTAGAVADFTYVDGNFMLYPGVPGPQGEVGPAGGPPGPEGPSAYDVAVAEGFIGDVTAWLLSLIGPQGDQGDEGPRGRSVLNGAAAPGGGDGENGDFWIKTTAPYTIYGPKALGAWPAGVSLVGPQGIQGIQGDQGDPGPAGVWGDLAGVPDILDAIASQDAEQAANKGIYFTGAGPADADTYDLTAFGRQLGGLANIAALVALIGGVAVTKFTPNNPGVLRLNCGGTVFSIMWGSTTVSANGSTTIVYPDGGFTSFSIPVGSGAASTGDNSQDNWPAVRTASKTSFTVQSANDNTSPFFWIAVGV